MGNWAYYSQTYLLGLSQNQMAQGSSLVNLATDRKIVMQQWAWFYAVCISAPNSFGLELYDIINYNDVKSRHIRNQFIIVRKGCWLMYKL